MDAISSMAGANTVIGEAVTTPNGTMIIPVSKLSMGYASGGLDYNSKKPDTSPLPPNFGGLGGSGLTVSPVAFLIVAPDGAIDMLNVNEPLGSPDPVSSIIGLIERSPDLIERLRNALSKDRRSE